jgi:hypothetical protein
MTPVTPTVALLASVLRGDSDSARSLLALSGDAPALDAARAHGVAPLVGEAVRARAHGRHQDDLAEALGRDSVHCAVVWALRSRELGRVLDRLADRRVEPILIKGVALAHTHYPRAMLRPSFDIDLFVDASQVPDVCRAFESLGYRRSRQVSGDMVMPQLDYEKRDPGGVLHIYDVHWKLSAPQAFRHVLTYAELEVESAPIPDLGPRARGAGNVHALLIACVHRVAHHSDDWRLIWLYDMHLLAGALTAYDWRRLVELASAKGMSGVCANGLTAAQKWLHTSLPEGILDELERVSVAAHEPSRRFLGGQSRLGALVSDLRHVRAWRDRWRIVQQHVFPPPAYMFQMYGTDSVPLLPALYTHRVIAGAWKWVRRSTP